MVSQSCRAESRQGSRATGRLLLLATAVEKDVVEAVKWFRKAADQNNAEAQWELGVCYYYGNGVEKDEVEAVKWFRKAAEQGLAFSQNDLGNRYLIGQGVAKDEAEAVKWFRKAAEQNYAQGSIQSGLLLRQWSRRAEGLCGSGKVASQGRRAE